MAPSTDLLLALLPLSIPLYQCLSLLLENNPVSIWRGGEESRTSSKDATSQQLLAYMTMAVLGYAATSRLVPNIQQYTLRKGICGKDLGKKGTPNGDQPM